MKALRHPATIIASLSLFVALGGGAWASGLISGAQIKNHTIAEKKLTKKAIRALRGHRGATGPAGPAGSPGPQGPTGPSSATSTSNTGSVVYGTAGAVVATLTLPAVSGTDAGSYVVFAHTTISDTGNTETTTCSLQLYNSTGTFDRASASTTVPAPQVESLHLVGPLATVGPAVVHLFCQSDDSNAKASNSHLVAIKLGSVSGS
jgi:hypothetical protein